MGVPQDEWQIAKITAAVVAIGGMLTGVLKLWFGHKETKQTEGDKIRDLLMARVEKLETEFAEEKRRCNEKIEELRDKADTDRLKSYEEIDKVRRERDRERNECNEKIDVLRRENMTLWKRIHDLDLPQGLPSGRENEQPALLLGGLFLPPALTGKVSELLTLAAQVEQHSRIVEEICSRVFQPKLLALPEPGEKGQ